MLTSIPKVFADEYVPALRFEARSVHRHHDQPQASTFSQVWAHCCAAAFLTQVKELRQQQHEQERRYQQELQQRAEHLQQQPGQQLLQEETKQNEMKSRSTNWGAMTRQNDQRRKKAQAIAATMKEVCTAQDLPQTRHAAEHMCAVMKVRTNAQTLWDDKETKLYSYVKN